MECTAHRLQAARDLKIVIRHDLDYEITNTWKMLEIERELGLTSVVYFDVHCKNYGGPEIVGLYEEFGPSGFLFGLHINIAYHHQGESECLEVYDRDLRILRHLGIEPHSVVAHYYPESEIPKPRYHNGHIELWSHAMWKAGNHFYPRSFHGAFLRRPPDPGRVNRLSDGGNYIYMPVEEYVSEYLKDHEHAWLSFHGIYYEQENGDLIFGGQIGKGDYDVSTDKQS